MLVVACGRSDPQWVEAPPPATGSQKFLGCIGPTSLPGRYTLAVAEGRNATYGAPPGTIVPEPSSLPPVAHEPTKPPTASVGLPGDGPNALTKIVTYNLVGSGSLDLNAHVGHTVEITGDVQEIPEAERAAGNAPDIRQLHVTSARHIADACLGDR